MSKAKDLTGMKFGRLTVIKRVENANDGHAQFLCKCECGTEKVIKGSNLTKEKGTKSCGCLTVETSRTQKGLVSKYPRLYNIYRNMISRCYNPKDKRYKDYGRRGVKICKDWRRNFMHFCEWSINNGYKKGLTIDRIDNNGNYEPNNCRWVSNKVQANNKRCNHTLTYRGETHTIAEWSEITGIKNTTLYGRINSYKWTPEQALTTPVKH